MVDSARAVFLSYASQDTEAARRICESLRADGIEVWFDQSELRGGDVWDQKIRQQIHDCAMFVPIISANTESRTEGYFRLEWKLAVDRSHLMADDAAFLFPVVIDDTPDQTARVPDKFRTVQWTRLPGGAAPAAFSQRVAALLCGSAKPVRKPDHEPSRPAQRAKMPAVSVAAVTLVAVATGWVAWWAMHRSTVTAPAVPKLASAAASAAPAHSIAVLPFADMSERRDQEYFSDGLSEELLNLLSKVPGLQVAARTSAFSFKGRATDIPTIGRQLVVANVLEGSVRKSGNHLRVTAQLVRADNGYEVWSGIYDRDIGDVFRLQDEIAAEVVKALKLTLLGNATPHGASTRSADTYLVFLKGRAKMATERMADVRSAADDFAQVVKLDPNYGPAYVELATAKAQLAEFEITTDRPAAFAAAVEEAKVLLEQALALDPSNAQAYVERGNLRAFSDRKGAEQDYRRGIELDPNSARAYEGLAGVVYQDPRRRDEVPKLYDRARLLDPLEPRYDVLKAMFLSYARSDNVGAIALLSGTVARHPVYLPALTHLADVKRVNGDLAETVMYDEQALKLEPLEAWTRVSLINAYLDLDEVEAARQVADEAPHELPYARLRLMLHDGDQHRAAAATYEALANGTNLVINEPWGVLALRIDARTNHDFDRARSALERMCGLSWSAQGVPKLPNQFGVAASAVGLADVLLASGQRELGERLLRVSLADMDYVAHDLRNGDLWHAAAKAVAFALLGDGKATMAALKRAMANYYTTPELWLDPALQPVAGNPEFQALYRQYRQKIARERQILERMRAEGRVPVRAH